MKKINFILLGMLIIFFNTLKSEDILSSPIGYPRQALGARPLSLGETGLILLEDANATYWNPAGLGNIKIGDFIGMGANTPFESSDDSTGYYFLSLATPYSLFNLKGGLGANIYYFGTKMIKTDINYPEIGALGEFFHYFTAATISYGFKIKENLLFGTNFKINYFYGGVSAEYAAVGVAFDFGTIWQTPIKNLKLGAILKHIGTDLKVTSIKPEKKGAKSKEPLPHTGAIGIGYTIIENEKHRLNLVSEPYFIWGRTIKSDKRVALQKELKEMVEEDKEGNTVQGYYYLDKIYGTGIKSVSCKEKIQNDKSPYYGCLVDEAITEKFKKDLEPYLEKAGHKWAAYSAEKWKDTTGTIFETTKHFGIYEENIARSYVYGVNVGLEYCYGDLLFVRIGRTNTLREPEATTKLGLFDQALTYGIGLNLRNKYNLDYANTPWGTNMRTHIFSLSIKFGIAPEE